MSVGNGHDRRQGNARSNVWYTSLTPISDSSCNFSEVASTWLPNHALYCLSLLNPLMCAVVTRPTVRRTTMLPVDQSERDLPISAWRYDLPLMQNHDPWVELSDG